MKHRYLLILLLLAPLAFADALGDAKNAGLVGERPDGLLGLVDESASKAVRALVAEVNQKREAEYARIAAANNLTLDQIRALAGKKAISKTEPGHWILADGAWEKK